MNGALIVLGMVVVSVVIARVLVYRISCLYEPNGNIPNGARIVEDQSSLNEDFRDILGFVPLHEVNAILESFIKYDRQIGDVTVGYINDNARYIIREFKRMPEFQWLVGFLRDNGMDVRYWLNQVAKRWKNIPSYLGTDRSVACGGLPSMVEKIMETIPREELHELLCQKLRYSASFRSLVEALRSPSFNELCEAVAESRALQRHYFWASDDEVEVLFGIELLRNFHTYMTCELR